jgi:hypothetical protein
MINSKHGMDGYIKTAKKKPMNYSGACESYLAGWKKGF